MSKWIAKHLNSNGVDHCLLSSLYTSIYRTIKVKHSKPVRCFSLISSVQFHMDKKPHLYELLPFTFVSYKWGSNVVRSLEVLPIPIINNLSTLQLYCLNLVNRLCCIKSTTNTHVHFNTEVAQVANRLRYDVNVTNP